jgi:hypothetical protein
MGDEATNEAMPNHPVEERTAKHDLETLRAALVEVRVEARAGEARADAAGADAGCADTRRCPHGRQRPLLHRRRWRLGVS